MPQMMPLNWVYLYIMFLTIMFFFIILNFFMKNFNQPYLIINKNNKTNKMIWKW